MSLSNYLSSHSNTSSSSKSNHDAIFDIQYKEYTFQTNPNKEVEEKVASFWREMGNRKPPNPENLKHPEIENGELTTEEEILSSEEQSIVEEAQENFKWTNTFCIFKKNKFDTAAKAAIPKKCSICTNDKFAPKFADETCHDVIKDYGHSKEDVTKKDSNS